MPAIWPPVRPWCLRAAAAGPVGEVVDDVVLVKVILIRFSDADATIGNETPLHIEVELEKTQHESVEFGELAAQYPHSPPRFDP